MKYEHFKSIEFFVYSFWMLFHIVYLSRQMKQTLMLKFCFAFLPPSVFLP